MADPPPPDQRLHLLVDDPLLARFWDAAHRRLEATGGVVSTTALHIRPASDVERTAIELLCGTRSRGMTMRIGLSRLDNRLQQRLGASLVQMATMYAGDVRDRPALRAAAVAAEAALWATAHDHAALATHPALGDWLLRLQHTGALRQSLDRTLVLDQTLSVLAQLPYRSSIGRSQLAARLLGDAHALDDGAEVGRLAIAAMAHLDGLSGRLGAAQRRALWARRRVVADETSSMVLTLGLRPRPAGPMTEAAARWADSHFPLPLPLNAVRGEPWSVDAGTVIWACENPAVLSAAMPTAEVVICLEGRPSVAALELLTSLAASGADLRYHGDFGSGGIGIGNQLFRSVAARPWRFETHDYLRALEQAVVAGVELRPIRGAVPDACWDPALAPAIRSAGVEVEEERVLDDLITDLSAGANAPLDAD